MKYFTSTSKQWPLLLLIAAMASCSSKGPEKSSTGSNEADSDFQADVEIELTAEPTVMQLIPGNQTDVFHYNAKLIKGEKQNLSNIDDSYLGPIIRVKRGQKIRVIFNNNLPRESIIHWHGLHIPPEMDGHPMHAIDNGETYVYEMEIVDRPGTYWFHPHPDKITGPQVYRGLAGLFIIEDDQAANLPSGEYDQPLVIQDRRLDADNQLIYLEGNRMEEMVGFLGDQVFINGKRNQDTEVKKGTYRFRVLNGSNARIYKLAWSDNSDITIIGTDGGLLEKPIDKPYLMLAPGERVEIWKDFSDYETKEQITLESLAFESGTNMGGMGGGMGNRMGGGMMQGSSAPENGAPMNLFTFSVTSDEGKVMELPQEFSEIERIDIAEAVNRDNPKQFHFFNERMNWVINGESFEMHEVADWEKVRLNTTEIWQFINGDNGGGMGMMQDMMQLPHPAHIHGLQFQIIERDVSEINSNTWNSVKDGFVNEGWQDTFLLMPGMKVNVIMRFRDFTGKYIYHCHNLEHEDMGMMRNYEVVE